MESGDGVQSYYRGILGIDSEDCRTGYGHFLCMETKTQTWISHLFCVFPNNWPTALPRFGISKEIDEVQNPLKKSL